MTPSLNYFYFCLTGPANKKLNRISTKWEYNWVDKFPGPPFLGEIGLWWFGQDSLGRRRNPQDQRISEAQICSFCTIWLRESFSNLRGSSSLTKDGILYGSYFWVTGLTAELSMPCHTPIKKVPSDLRKKEGDLSIYLSTYLYIDREREKENESILSW